ncbi:MAG TPA: antitoxin family protein [Planctomycetota bacterium]|nr:antitoxin family protein [Planctomycetota bacterium]
MTITVEATYENGSLKLDRAIPLNEKARVQVTILPVEQSNAATAGSKDPLAGVIGICKGGPKDLAENHDKYIYGAAGNMQNGQ